MGNRKKRMTVYYDVSDRVDLYDIEDLNSSFAKGTLKVMYTGKNRNNSAMSKASVTDALPSLMNVPIVCHYDVDSNEIGGHDVEVVTNPNGGLTMRNLTTPIGVVPESAKFKFEVMEDDDGIEHEYLVVNNVILWKRQKEVYEHIVNDLDGHIGHSMEISIIDGKKDKSTGCYEINKFEFTALCLLETATPCFQGSELELFALDQFKVDMESMMTELRDTLSSVNSPVEGIDTYTNKNSEEGGVTVLEEKMALVSEYGIDVNHIDFSIEDFTVEELREKFEAMKSEPSAEDNATEFSEEPAEAVEEEPAVEEPAEEPVADEEPAEEFELNDTVRRSIEEAVCSLGTVQHSWGDEPQYFVIDFDSEKSMVYAMDCADWKMYGFAYSMNGDNVVVDESTKTRMKWAIVEYDNGEQSLPLAGMFDNIEAKYSDVVNREANTSANYQSASEQIASMTAELDELRQFKQNIEDADASAQRQSVLDQFEDLMAVEAFAELCEHASEYDIETLEEKCYAIRGRNGTVAKFSMEQKNPKLAVVADQIEEPVAKKPYGGVVEYYTAKN